MLNHGTAMHGLSVAYATDGKFKSRAISASNASPFESHRLEMRFAGMGEESALGRVNWRSRELAAQCKQELEIAPEFGSVSSTT